MRPTLLAMGLASAVAFGALSAQALDNDPDVQALKAQGAAFVRLSVWNNQRSTSPHDFRPRWRTSLSIRRFSGKPQPRKSSVRGGACSGYWRRIAKHSCSDFSAGFVRESYRRKIFQFSTSIRAGLRARSSRNFGSMRMASL